MRWIYFVSMMFAAASAQAGGPRQSDFEASLLVQHATLLAARNDSGVAPSATDRQQIDQDLRAISALEVQLERGLISVSHKTWRDLERVRESLMGIPVTIIDDQRGVPSLGTISGTITGPAGPLQNATVQANEFSLGFGFAGPGVVSSTVTDANGGYTLTLPAGNYVIRVTANAATPTSTTGYRRRVYDDLACDSNSRCPGYFGTVVPLSSGGAVGGIDLFIPVGGAVSGTVTRASDASPVTSGTVFAQDEGGSRTFSGAIGADGSYTITGLASGNYRVWAVALVPGGLMAETGGDLSCSPDDCQWLPAPMVAVTEGSTTNTIDFALDPSGSLSGVIQDESAAPLAGAYASLYSEDGYLQKLVSTDASGQYSFGALRSGNYRIIAYAPSSASINQAYAPVAYPNQYCPSGACNPVTSGAAITFVAGVNQTLSAIQLPAFGHISGQVRDAVSNAPIADATIQIIDSANLIGATGRTDAAGNYQIGGLPPASYFIYADARNANYVGTFNGDVVCPEALCRGLGVPVTLTGSAPGNAGTANIMMQKGGQITGTITDAQTGAPALHLRTRLELYSATTQNFVSSYNLECLPPTITTPVSCSYTAKALPPGVYKGVFAGSTVIGLQDTAFGGSFCPRGGCDQSALPPLFATTGGTLSGINVTMPRGVLVRGRITDAATGAGPDCRPYDVLSFGIGSRCTSVAFYNQLDNYAGFGVVDRRGDYYLNTGLPPGTTVYASTFALSFNVKAGFGYVDQAFAGLICPFGSCGITNGTGITVTSVGATGVDMALVKGGSIAGQITTSDGASPLPGVRVEAYTTAGRLAGFSKSDLNGDYRVPGLPPGDYYVTTRSDLGYLDEVYNNLSCEPFCNPLDGTAVTLVGTAMLGGINFALDLSASIAGTVRAGGAPAANVGVELYGFIGNLLRTTVSNTDGAYSFSGLPAGRYYVRTRDTLGRADVLFSGFPCVGNACQVRQGTPIDLAPPATPSATADLDLAAPASISGTVSSVPGGTAVSGVRVELLAASGALALIATTDGSGNFSFNGLSGGSYYMVTRGTAGLIDVAYPNTPCPAACNGLNGSAIAVTAGVSLGNQNFALSSGGSVSGSVRSGPSAPIVGATVQVFNAAGVPVGQISSNASGNYQIDTLPSGNYFVRTEQSQGFVDQVFNALPCSGYCDVLSGTAVPVTAGIGTGLVDFTLAGGASISGRVSNADNGSGIASARVVAFDPGGFVAGQAQADASGNYSIAGLRPGIYRLRTANLSSYVNQVHAGISCSPTPCSVAAGTPIAIDGSNVTGINFALSPGSTISGTAGDTFNNPLPSGTAVLLDSNGNEVAVAPISNGLWEFNGLANGTYYILIRNTSGLVDLLFANTPCPAGACNIPALGTPIVLAATRRSGGAANINLRLSVGQTISGTVRDAGNSNPLNGVTVFFFDATGAVAGQAQTDALGAYISQGGLLPGTYYAATANGSQRGAGQGYVNALYAGQPCPLSCDVTSGTAIAVNSTSVSGVDFNLNTAGLGVTGTVRDGSGQPLPLVSVEIYAANGYLAGTATSNSQGVYAINGLPAANYFARTRNNIGLADRLFGGGACGAGCNPLSGTAIAVPASAQIGNIDFTLLLPDPLFGNGFE
ncbi:MAG: carboxypeptidase regulatory-like domain-containing protein [Xanthomonadales bacterium]|nr:carboxypeptidase regulatory-like domain-containing protein [Xanthomonadales bacterium]